MRVFFALESDDMEKPLKDVQEKLPKDGLKHVKVFHLTLKLFRDFQESQVYFIEKKLADFKFEPLTVSLDKLWYFPPMGKIRTIWSGIKPNIEIIDLQKQLDAAIVDEFREEINFVPHITLARVRKYEDDLELLNIIKTTVPSDSTITFNKITLIKSTLGPNGPVYEELYSLKAVENNSEDLK